MGEFYIGWAEESLVPDKKVDLRGQFFERISTHVESEISVTAMAVEADGDHMIMISADLIAMDNSLLEMARDKLRVLTNEIDPEKIMVAATHTHTSLRTNPTRKPTKRTECEAGNVAATVKILEKFLPEGKKYESLVTPDESVLTPEEGAEFVSEKIALAAFHAWNNRQKSLYANEFGRAAVGMNRRVCYDDGSAQMWGDTNSANFVSLEGGNDSGIELIYTFDTNKNLTGIVANIACPAQILEQRSFISADFWGRAKANLRKKFGDHIYLLGLGGAGGDQCPRDLVRWVEPETPIDDPNVKRPHLIKRKADPSMFDVSGCNRVGRRISDEIIAVFEEISEYKSEAAFTHKVIELDVPLRKATMAEYENAVREIEYYVEKHKDKPFTFEDNAYLFVHAGLIERFYDQQTRETVPIEYHVIRFGDVAFATNPYELFLDYANVIKARSYAEQTFIVQLCNGCHGYLPTEKAERGGHYSAYISTGDTGHEGGDLLVRETITHINGLWGK